MTTELPYAHFTLDDQSRLADANPRALRLVGYLREELVGRALSDFVAPEDAAPVAAAIAGAVEEIHCTLVRRDGERREVVLTAGPAGISAVDVTNAVASNARRLTAILESVTDGFVALDRDWRYSYVNRRGGEMLGRDARSLVGKHIWTEFPEGVDQPFHRAYRRVMATAVPESIEAFYEPWKRWFENRIYASDDGITIFFQDITERKSTEQQLRDAAEQLRALSHRVDVVREEEAARISREIHDELGQTLTALKFDVAWLGRHDDRGAREDRLERLGTMSEQLDSAIGSVRRICTELRPAMLDELGLGAAMEWLANSIGERAELTCHVQMTGADPPRTSATATALFRILQELLTNVMRHAEASSVEIALTEESDAFVLEVRDDGRGAGPGAFEDPRSIGIVGMRERAKRLGGTLTLESVVGVGTTARVRVPRPGL